MNLANKTEAMKANINEIETLIGVLDSFNYVEVDENKGLVADNGFRVGYMTNELTSVHDLENYPLQILVVVRGKGGEVVYTWGCTDNEMNNKFMKWYIVKKSKTMSVEWKAEDKRRDEGKAEFEALLVKQLKQEA